MYSLAWFQNSRLGLLLVVSQVVASCGLMAPSDEIQEKRLRRMTELVREVKEFGKTLGIEPTEALGKSSATEAPLSMLWFWMQRVGTLALRQAIDVRLAIGFSQPQEQLKLEQVYRVDGYSVYYRQGNEFADPRSVATPSFAEEGLLRQVKVILHEDLHGDHNFRLSWEVEEGIVTPLSSLAAAEFFKQQEDLQNTERALGSVAEERQIAREINLLAAEAEGLFRSETLDQAKKRILARLEAYPTYYRQFQRQIAGQNTQTALEAKLSHDLAYYRFFDAIAALAEKTPSLKILIEELKRLPHDATVDELEKYLWSLNRKYLVP